MRRVSILIAFILLTLTNIVSGTIVGDTPPASGDWIVNNDTYVADEVITLTGNLMVNAKLDLVNTTIQFNVSSDGEYGINVTSTGELNINQSSIIQSCTDYNYFFVVNNGASFTIEDSIIQDCGWADFTAGDALLSRGLMIKTDNVSIINTSIYVDSGYGIRGVTLYYADNATIKDNYIEASVTSTDNWGIYLTHSNGNTIYNNTIKTTGKKGHGIFLSYSKNNNISSNSISVSGIEAYGIFVELYSEGNVLRQNNVSSSLSRSFWLRDYINNNYIDETNLADGKPVKWINTSSVIDGGNYGEIIVNANNVVVKSITLSGADGLFFSSCSNVTIWDIQIDNVTSGGIWFYGSDNVSMHNITIKDVLPAAAGVSAIVFRGTDDVTAEDITIFTTKIDVHGIRMYSSASNISLRSLNINTGDAWTLDIEDSSEISVTDAYLYASARADAYIYNANVNFTNVTFVDEDYKIEGTSLIYRKWYLDVQTKFSNDLPISNADVEIYNGFGELIFSGEVNETGAIGRQTVIAYNQTADTTVWFTNYTVNVTYLSNQWSNNFNLSSNKVVEYVNNNASGLKVGKEVTNYVLTNGVIDYGTTTSPATIDMYITPAIDIIKAYDADYDASTNTWTVTIHSDISQPVAFNISTGLANQEFNIYRNGSLIATVTTTSDGWLNWTYDGGFSTWVFTFEPAEEEEEEVKEDWITVEPTSISVEVAKGSTKTESIKIRNNMDFPITVTLGLSGINEDEVYVTYPKQVYLNYYQTKEVKIRFRGLKEGTYEGTLFVCANGCYRIPVTVKVTKYIPPIVIPTPKPAIPGFEAVAAVVAVTAVVALRMGRLKVRRRS